jgi:hypothetical protein
MVELLKIPQASRGWLGFQALALGAFVLFVLTNVRPMEIGAAIAATGLLIATRLFGSWSERETRTIALGFSAAALLLIIGLAAGPWRPYILLTSLFILPLVAACVMLVWRGKVEARGMRLLVTAVLVLIVVLIGVLWIVPVKPPAVDVLDLHRSAAEVLLDGRNPYTDAYSVNTSPFAPEGAEFVGYTYPPLALVAYAGSDVVFGDPRWASVIAIALVIVLITRPWQMMTKHQAVALIALGLAFVVNPWLGTVVWFGWTDPISLPLLLGAALLWRKNPVWAAVLLGVALGTKQYFVMALPLLLAWNDSFRWKRLSIAGGVAALSILPGLLFGPANFWNATIGPSIGAQIRPDSSGLAGIGWETPFWLVIALSIGVAVWMGRNGGPGSRFMLGLGATLAIAFLVGSQAFLNYWFFVGALALFAVAVSVSTAATNPEESEAVPTAELAGSMPDPTPGSAD